MILTSNLTEIVYSLLQRYTVTMIQKLSTMTIARHIFTGMAVMVLPGGQNH